MGAIGFSLGGAALALATPALRVDALVLESVFPTLDSTIRNRVGLFLPLFAGVMITRLFAVLMPPILGFRVSDVQPVIGIGRVTAPLLVISGTLDTRSRLDEAKTLFEAAPEPKSFWAVEGAGHVHPDEFDPGAYWARVLPFLVERLRGPVTARP